MNDAQPLPDKEVNNGVLVSIRNLSSVLLFVPAIEWLQTSPWLNQQDVNYLDYELYSVFGINVVRGPEKILGGHSEIYLFNSVTG